MDIKEQINGIKWVHKNKCFLFTSVSMFLICCFATMGADDIGSMRVQDGTIIECWEKTIAFYHTWSSRVLINFVIFILTSKAKVFWAVYMGCSLFALQKAFSILFLDNDKEKYNTLISLFVLAYSFREMSSAGWIATSCTYLGPIACGFIALIPIKKLIKSEKLMWWEYFVYIICLFYSANNEQMLIVILGACLAALSYGVLSRRWSKFLVVMTLMSIANLVFILTCPGNHNRAGVELVVHNPTYGMLNFLNKFDLGLATTERYFLFENRIIILACIMFAVLVFEKYKDLICRIISCIPIVCIVSLSVFKDVVIKVYPSLEMLTREIPNNGLVNTQNAGRGYSICQYFVMGMIILMICIEIFLLQDNFEGIVINFTLLAAGIASGIAMGFSPTIFASGKRVYAVMDFCIMAVALCTILNCTNRIKDKGTVSVLLSDRAQLFYEGIIIASLLDLWCFAMTRFV